MATDTSFSKEEAYDRNLKGQVDTIRQAFSYITRFQGKIFVIKIDGNLFAHRHFPILIKDLALLHSMGIKIVLVPGTKERIDEILGTFDISYSFKNGVRIVNEEAMPFLKMAAFDVANQLMTALAENSINGVIGNLVRARSIGVRDGVDYCSTGQIDKVNLEVIHKMLDEGMVPIFPTIGWSLTGKPYNISSDELAVTISERLNAAKLFFISDFSGFVSDMFQLPPELETLKGIISRLTIGEAQAILDRNPPTDENRRAATILKLSCRAVASGVPRAHIVDGRVEGTLLKEIFSNLGTGTMIYSNQHENIRPLRHKEIAEILVLTKELTEEGILIKRSAEDIAAQLDDYAVYEVDNTIHACGALRPYKDGAAEIYSIAVDRGSAGSGLGKRMITYLLEKARNSDCRRVFLLTTRTSDWFAEMGFRDGTLEDLPAEKSARYDHRRKSRILIMDLE